MRLLLVEDEPTLRTSLYALLRCTYAVDAVGCVKDAANLCSYTNYDVAILDLHLPDGSGLSLIEPLRQHQDTPVLILTGNETDHALTEAFNHGADDFVVKPHRQGEIESRLTALLRRQPTLLPKEISLGSLKICKDTRAATVNGRPLQLRNQEFLILEYLARNADRFISKAELIEKLWSEHNAPFSNCIESHIKSIRIAYKNNHEPCPITTSRNIGYKIAS